ncbi:hypothetical protein B0H14DRAFT_2578519 [Mycena olivaceomarginata]|nr:hypothetical protein B0H14DRAFT_2578519 [Mycena olivaceomarginata]
MADTTEPDDPTLCTNPDASGESCGGSFDHKSSPGLCAMCYMATKDAARAEAMKDWPQCTGCSAQLKLLKGARCGPCLRKDQPNTTAEPSRTPLGTYDPNQPDPESSAFTNFKLKPAEMQCRPGHFKRIGKKSVLRALLRNISHFVSLGMLESSHAALSELWASFLTPMTVSMEVIPSKSFKKRKASQTTQTSTSELRRTRSEKSAPLPLRSEIGDLPGFSKIGFLFASVSVGNDDTQFDQDKTKMVYKVIYEGFPWVAKWFFDIGAGEGRVEIHDNREQLIREAIPAGPNQFLSQEIY